MESSPKKNSTENDLVTTRKVRYTLDCNVLKESLRIPLKRSLTVAEAAVEIGARISKVLGLHQNKITIKSLQVCVKDGQRNLLDADDTLEDALDDHEISLFADVEINGESTAHASPLFSAALAVPESVPEANVLKANENTGEDGETREDGAMVTEDATCSVSVPPPTSQSQSSITVFIHTLSDGMNDEATTGPHPIVIDRTATLGMCDGPDFFVSVHLVMCSFYAAVY